MTKKAKEAAKAVKEKLTKSPEKKKEQSETTKSKNKGGRPRKRFLPRVEDASDFSPENRIPTSSPQSLPLSPDTPDGAPIKLDSPRRSALVQLSSKQLLDSSPEQIVLQSRGKGRAREVKKKMELGKSRSTKPFKFRTKVPFSGMAEWFEREVREFFRSRTNPVAYIE